MKIASIDIGTNTCNLSIAEYFPNRGLKFLCKEKEVITLINSQFKEGVIADGPIFNLIEVLKRYKKIIDKFHVKKVIATATSGIRSSLNKDEIVNAIHSIIGIRVNVIDGHSEARFVYEGVRNAVDIGEQPVLIIDIGGGSIEFIICDDKGIISTYSFDIGAARLLNRHNFSDPLTEEDIEILRNILDSRLNELISKSKELKIDTLIGSSGSFETFVDLINNEITVRNYGDSQTYNVLDIQKFEIIFHKLINYDYSQRADMPGMSISRVYMIPIAGVITQYLIKTLNIRNLIQSRYSIKEGLIFDYIRKNFEN